MKNASVRLLSLFLFLSLLLCIFSGCSQGQKSLKVSVKEITKHGNVILDTDFDTLLAHDMEVGDLITVTVGKESYELPIGKSFTDVNNGQMICRFDTEDDQVALAINMGSFATDANMGTKTETAAEPGYQWDIRISEVTLVLKEKQGYLNEFNARNLSRTDAREDYPELSDEQFANFRAVSCTGIRKNLLFRSSSPVEAALCRNTYAMSAMQQAGIKTVLNLDDTFAVMSAYDAYPGSYYSRCSILNCALPYDYSSAEFSLAVKICVEYIVSSDAPYLIHCKEGQNRTGILCALLECYMGGSLAEVEKDYMLTYENYYRITSKDPVYAIVLKNNLTTTLCGLFGTDDLTSADLQQEANEYFLSAGLTQDILSALTYKLD